MAAVSEQHSDPEWLCQVLPGCIKKLFMDQLVVIHVYSSRSSKQQRFSSYCVPGKKRLSFLITPVKMAKIKNTYAGEVVE